MSGKSAKARIWVDIKCHGCGYTWLEDYGHADLVRLVTGHPLDPLAGAEDDAVKGECPACGR